MKPFKYRINYFPSACGGITMGAPYDCVNPIMAGVSQRLVLIPKVDWDLAIITYDEEILNMIVDIDLGTALGFAFDGIRKSIVPQSAYVPSPVASGFDHQIEFLIFDISAEQKYNIEEMTLAKGIVGIVQNTNVPGNDNSIFEVFGAGAGLEIQAGPMRLNGDNETNGAYQINLKTSDDGGKEQHLPLSLWDTDFATTLDLVDSLLTNV